MTPAPTTTPPAMPNAAPAALGSPAVLPGTSDYITIRDFDFFYGQTQALHAIAMDIPEKQVTPFIGPSRCGKST